MRQFKWTPENEVFLTQVDSEHRELFRIADGLQRAIAEGAAGVELRKHMQSLTAATEEHFSHEEWLMQSVAYPSYGWHKQQHETARRRLKLFRPLIEGGETEAADVFLEFLAGWLNDHTSLTDRMMAAHVRNYERAHATNASAGRGEPASARQAATSHETGPFPKTIQFCRICGDQTTHEMRPGGIACIKCVARGVSAELDRD